jgi:hypothetical protein
VTGEECVGGLAGLNYGGGEISNSYSAVSVDGNEFVDLVGDNYWSEISNSFYDEVNGQGVNGTPLTTNNMKSAYFAATLNIFASAANSGESGANYLGWSAHEGEYPKHTEEIQGIIDISSFFEEGNGTAEAPYIIETKEQLINLAVLTTGYDFEGEYITLAGDIMLNDTANWASWETNGAELTQWIPIGNDENRFRGIFNGAGHTVAGIYINAESSGDQGLFGINEGTIANLGVVASFIKGDWNVGGLAGVNYGTIGNSYFAGRVTGGECVGGLAGDNWGGSISNSYSAATVAGTNYVGGLTGWNDGAISNSYSAGDVEGNDFVGGLVGYNDGGSISNSYSVATVAGTNYVGGLTGWNSGAIGNSYFTGRVTGEECVGGLAGLNYGGGEISNSYSAGAGAGTGEFVGGLAGVNDGGEISNSFYNSDDFSSDNGWGTPKTTTQMQTQITFSGWDFTNVWAFVLGENSDYPVLSWQEFSSSSNASSSSNGDASSSSGSDPQYSSGSGDEPQYSSSSGDEPQYSSSSGDSSSSGESASSGGGEDVTIIAGNPSAQFNTEGVSVLSNVLNLMVKNSATLEIYNLNGTKVRAWNFKSGSYSVSLNDLPKGLYIAKARLGSETKAVKIPIK